MQLQQNISRFDDAGIAVFAISYDPVERQAAFAREFGISFPLLSDPDSVAIRATGILNTLIEPDEDAYGIPFPGTYVIGADGAIEEKRFFQSYRTRLASETLLRDGLGLDFEIRDNPHADVSGQGVSVSVTLGATGLVFGERSNLYVDISLDDGLHLYGTPIPDGYIATEVSVTGPEDIEIGPVQFPPTVPFRVEGLPEEFNVFEGGRVSISVPVVNLSRDAGTYTLRVVVRYQACSATECFIPQTHTLLLDAERLTLNTPDPK